MDQPSHGDAEEGRILVPLDESRRAELALEPAARIARRTGCSLSLLTVPLLHEEPHGPPVAAIAPPEAELRSPDELVESAHETSLRYLARVRARLAESSVEADLHVVHRLPAEAIVDLAEEVDASLIVMATHGRSGITRWALGSVADKVLQTARRPVLVTRQAAGWGIVGPRSILVALDGSPLAETVLPQVEWLAGAFEASITLAHVLPMPLGAFRTSDPGDAAQRRQLAEDYLAERARELSERGFEVRTEIRAAQHVAEALLELDAREDVDLLAMTTHGHGGLRRWAYGSVADRMIRSATTPVLILRTAEDAGA